MQSGRSIYPFFFKLSVLPVLLAAFTACSEPESVFGAPPATIEAGDTIRADNNSKGAERYEWYFNDEKVSTEKNLRYLPVVTASGVHTITLKVFDGEQVAQSSHTLMIEAPSGTITAWSTFAGVQILRIGNDGAESLGYTSGGFENDPGCNAAGAVVFTLVPGTYTIDGLSEVTRTRKVVEVSDKGCVQLKMH